ncbi:MAG: UDP-N-acetylmuramoyl-L-alanine--D-glutamate ligase [Caldisericia bacterium]|nr:UDP-N-acetylmuramoyl-L-alanine--D-glutamate ligase [Caldisericia bacterium]
MKYKGKKISIIGIGGTKRSGFYTALLLKKEGAEVFVSEIKKEVEFQKEIEEFDKLGIKYEFGVNSEKILDGDIIVLCPGVPREHQIVQKAKSLGKIITGELELSFEFINGDVVGITGTSGKSTTTALTYELIKRSGVKTHLGGNIGIPLSSLVINEREGIFVLEISAFQLETIKKFRPKIGVFLNFHEDHLDRYKNLGEYFLFKKRIFENQLKTDYAILNYDDEKIRDLSKEINSKVLYFSMKKDVEGIFYEKGKIFLNLDGNKEYVIDREEISLIGDFNTNNIMAATLASYLVTKDLNSIREGLKEFKALPHRLEFVTEINGVKFINDSKSTKPESSKLAISSFPPKKIIIILGGSSKKSDFRELCELVKERAKFAVCIGVTKDEFVKIFNEIDFKDYVIADDLKEAIRVSYSKAERGDIILLSPACASFDMFIDFEDRGEKFKGYVLELKNEKEV